MRSQHAKLNPNRNQKRREKAPRHFDRFTLSRCAVALIQFNCISLRRGNSFSSTEFLIFVLPIAISHLVVGFVVVHRRLHLCCANCARQTTIQKMQMNRKQNLPHVSHPFASTHTHTASRWGHSIVRLEKTSQMNFIAYFIRAIV